MQIPDMQMWHSMCCVTWNENSGQYVILKWKQKFMETVCSDETNNSHIANRLKHWMYSVSDWCNKMILLAHTHTPEISFHIVHTHTQINTQLLFFNFLWCFQRPTGVTVCARVVNLCVDDNHTHIRWAARRYVILLDIFWVGWGQRSACRPQGEAYWNK